MVNSDESDTKPGGAYRHTRTRIGAIAPINYSALARDIEVNDSHSAIAESQASNSPIEKEAFIYMTNTPEETARRFVTPRFHGYGDVTATYIRRS